MNILTVFAFPISTIILSIVLEKIIRSPILTTAAFFAVYLIITFSFFDATFLINVIIYCILAYIFSILSEIIFCRYYKNRINNQNINYYTNSENDRIINISENSIKNIAKEITRLQKSNNVGDSPEIINKNNYNNNNMTRNDINSAIWHCTRR